MFNYILKYSTIIGSIVMPISSVQAGGHTQPYGPFPVTLEAYTGDADNSVSYSGQIARHILHDSLKVLAGQGDGGENSQSLKMEMLSYFSGSDKNKKILAPLSKDAFLIKQTTLNEISSDKKLDNLDEVGVKKTELELLEEKNEKEVGKKQEEKGKEKKQEKNEKN